MSGLVTFGEAMLRYSPPGHTRLESTETLEVRVAGAESNVATAASRVGADALWISKLPESPLGRRVTNFLHSYGLETDVVWSDRGRQGTYYIEFGGAPRGTDVIYDRTDAAVTTATAEELPTHHIESADLFATSGITPALSATLEQTTRDLLALAHESATTTVFDLNYRRKLWSPQQANDVLSTILPAVDILVVGERDADLVLDVHGEPPAICEQLVDDWGCETVVLTRGAEGATALADGALIDQPIFTAEIHDPIGTGDAFLGGLLARHLAGDTWEEALEYGAATAALKLTIPGDIAAVTPDEVEAVIESDTVTIDR